MKRQHGIASFFSKKEQAVSKHGSSDSESEADGDCTGQYDSTLMLVVAKRVAVSPQLLGKLTISPLIKQLSTLFQFNCRVSSGSDLLSCSNKCCARLFSESVPFSQLIRIL
jgi:hypothetical protein